MKGFRWVVMVLLFAFGLPLLFACETGGDDDDTADDDTTDDDTDDDSDYCDSLTDEEKNLFKTIFCAGSSNSWSDDFGEPPYTMEDLSAWYHGKITIKAMDKLSECVDYAPALWVYWYDDVGKVREGTTLSWAIDSFYHFLDDDPEPETFRQRVADYLATLFGGLNEGVFFIGANIPKVMMLEYTGDKDEILEIIADEMGKYQYTVTIDLNYYMEKLLAGKVYYNGELIGPLDILKDQLHVNELGHQLLADIIIGVINEIWPELQIETWGTIEIKE